MLTKDEVFEIVAVVLKEHGPEDLRAKTHEEIVAEFQANILADPDSGPMVNMLMSLFEAAYEAGRKSVQI